MTEHRLPDEAIKPHPTKKKSPKKSKPNPI